MARYHVNPTTGVPGVCRALQSCPFGDLQEDHYKTKSEAAESYSAKMKESELSTVSKQSTFQKKLSEIDGSTSEVSPEEEARNISAWTALADKSDTKDLMLGLFKNYTTFDFRPMNAILRRGENSYEVKRAAEIKLKEFKRYRKGSKPDFEEKIRLEVIDKAKRRNYMLSKHLKKFTEAVQSNESRNYKLYRGFGDAEMHSTNKRWDELIPELEERFGVGRDFKDEGFMSTSSSEVEAKKFGSVMVKDDVYESAQNRIHIIMRIRTKPVPSFKSVSKYEFENEYLMDKGQEFVSGGIETDRDNKTVYVDLYSKDLFDD